MRHGLLIALLSVLTLHLLSGVASASHYAVTEIPTLISASEAEKLSKAGVGTTEDLLQKGAKPKDRKALVKASGLSSATVMILARRCDLLRIKGVGPEMVLLLEAAGVKTTTDLSKKEPGALTTATGEVNKVKKITDKPPTEPQFQDWIDQAKQLPTILQGP